MKKLLVSCLLILSICGSGLFGLYWFVSMKPPYMPELMGTVDGAIENYYKANNRWPETFAEVEQQCKKDGSYENIVKWILAENHTVATVSSEGNTFTIKYLVHRRGRDYPFSSTVTKKGNEFENQWIRP